MRELVIFLAAVCQIYAQTLSGVSAIDQGSEYCHVGATYTNNVTSTTSNTISTMVAVYTFTIPTGLPLIVGQTITATANSTNYIQAGVSSYNPATGVLVIDTGLIRNGYILGSGTYTSWTFNLNTYAQLVYGTTGSGGPFPKASNIGLTNQLETVVPAGDGKITLNMNALQPGLTYYGQIQAHTYTSAALVGTGGTNTLTVSNVQGAGISVGSSFVYTDSNENNPSLKVTNVTGSTLTMSGTFVDTFTGQIYQFIDPTPAATANVTCVAPSGPINFPPTPPTVFRPPYPSTTNYTTITLKSVGGLPEAAATVTHAANARCAGDPGWTVTANDSLAMILTEINYGAIIEVPQGVMFSGYTGPWYGNPLPVDPCVSLITNPNHGWILWRTNQINASDFPPFTSGNVMPFRTSPAWSGNLGGFTEQFPNGSTTGGQVFALNLQSTSANPIHHYWFSNLNIATQAYNTGYSTTTNNWATGSESFTVNAGLNYPAGLVLNMTAAPVSMTGTVTSQTGLSVTASITSKYGTGTLSSWAILCNENTWSNTSITIPTGTLPQSITFNVAPEFVLTTGNAITLYDWNAQQTMPGTVTSNTGTNLTVNTVCGSCSGSNSNWVIMPQFYGPSISLANGEGNPSDQANPASYIVMDRLLISGVTPTTSAMTFTGVGLSGSPAATRITGSYLANFQRYGFNPAGVGIGFYGLDCAPGPFTTDNTQITASGQTFYTETVSSTGCGPSNNQAIPMLNTLLEGNMFYMPTNTCIPYTHSAHWTWDGIERGQYRNPFETKQGHFYKIRGTWFDGSCGSQNSGAAIEISSSPSWYQGTDATGVHDLDIGFNYFNNVGVPFEIFGQTPLATCCLGFYPESQQFHNVAIHHSLGYNLGRHYNNGGQINEGGLSSGYFTITNAQNESIYNNTLNFIDAQTGFSCGIQCWIPELFTSGNGGPVMNGWRLNSNLYFMSNAGAANYLIAPPTPCQGCGGTPQAPIVDNTTYTTIFNTQFLQSGVTNTASGVWFGNTVIGGNYGGSGAVPWTDLTSAQVSSVMTNMPNISSDQYPNITCASPPCIPQRVAQAGLANWAAGDFNLTPNPYNFGGAVGTNIPEMESALGIVKGISVNVAPTAIQMNYTAPTSDACSLDVQTGGTWLASRATASGGSRVQTVTYTGLTAGTAYNYRLMCRFAQIGSSGPDEPWFAFPSEHGNMQTEGTVSTTASGTSTGAVQFSFPSTATSVVMTLTPLTGSPVVQTCSASPCVFSSITRGDYFASNVYKNSGGSQVSAGPAGVVSVR